MTAIAKSEPEAAELYTLQLPSKQESVLELDSFIESLRERYAIPEENYANMITALQEAVLNAILHGNKHNANKRVYVNLEVLGGQKFIFTIADEGSGFDYENLPDPTSAENLEKPAGRGVFIMKHLADQFIYSKNGSEIELHFKV